MKKLTYLFALFICVIGISGCGQQKSELPTITPKQTVIDNGYKPTEQLVEYDYQPYFRQIVKDFQDSKAFKGSQIYQKANMFIAYKGEEPVGGFKIYQDLRTDIGMKQVYFYINQETPIYGVYTYNNPELFREEKVEALYIIKGEESSDNNKDFYPLGSEEDNKINKFTIIYKQPDTFLQNYIPELLGANNAK